nr:iron-containing alcohol dehydrogenase [bacterium]
MPEGPGFRFATSGTIIFGPGSLPRVREKLPPEGAVLVVTGNDVSRARPLLDLIEEHGLEARVFPVAREPDIETVSRAREAGAEAECRAVVAIGGGSALDAGKAAAALIANPGDPRQYLEVVGEGNPLRSTPLPFIAVPTTAGTGSEATRNAVIACPEQSVKVSLRSYLLLPALAVVDPELALTLPPRPTAESGMDALAQLLEGFISLRASPLTDAIAREGLRAAGRGLRRAYRHGSDLEARTEMALAALCSGMVLANAGLGAPHGFAGPLGGMFPVPHGAACARLLAPALAVTLEA